jgi:hypothetical protein
VTLQLVGSEFPPVAFVWTWEENEKDAYLTKTIISEVTEVRACRYLMIQKTGGVADLYIGGDAQAYGER